MDFLSIRNLYPPFFIPYYRSLEEFSYDMAGKKEDREQFDNPLFQ